MMTHARIVLVLGFGITVLAAEAQLGSSAWLPSPEAPLLFRGDYTGNFPGATPPLRWDERSGAGIAWRTTMPGYSCSSPIVVGDKVFTMAGPDLLVCCDAATGNELWTGSVLDVMFPKLKETIVQEQWRELYRQEFCWGLMSEGRQAAMVTKAAALLPDNDGLQKFVAHKRVKDTKGGSTGQPVPLSATNHRKGRAYEAYWTADTFVAPISDGKYIWARWSFCRTVACFTMDGKRVWARALGNNEHVAKKKTERNPSGMTYKGTTNELLVSGDQLYVVSPKQYSCLAILDKHTGKEIIAYDRKQGPRIESGQAFCLMTIDGERYIVTQRVFRGHPEVFRARDGKRFGPLKGLAKGGNGVFGPNLTGWVVEGDIMYVGLGDYYFKKENGAIALRISKQGDAFHATTLWRTKGTKTAWCGVVKCGGTLFVAGHGMKRNMYDSASGKVIGKPGEMLSPLVKQLYDKAATSLFSYPSVAGGKIYQTIRGGVTAVIDPQTGQTLAENVTEPTWGSNIFFHGDKAYVRGLTSLYCLGGS